MYGNKVKIEIAFLLAFLKLSILLDLKSKNTLKKRSGFNIARVVALLTATFYTFIPNHTCDLSVQKGNTDKLLMYERMHTNSC